ncbi:MAG: hypothetical protein J6P02_06330 [Lachnospiraceae bacterium]|nr:hypothetical protein [Lachnospiraceae bacterium]
MEKKNKLKTVTHPAVIIVTALALAFSTISLIRVASFTRTRAEEGVVAEDISYSVYIGLTDKNQNRQIIEDDVALELVKTICINNNVAYTIYNANGGYNDGGILHTEKTLVLEMDRIDEETLDKIINDIKRRLNIHSVMVMKKPVEIFDR